jgi:formylglycine-generating enzyme required for sulfatase activity
VLVLALAGAALPFLLRQPPPGPSPPERAERDGGPDRKPFDPKAPSFVNAAGMKMLRLGPGRFHMGSPTSDRAASEDERPRHEVEITRPFYLGETEVTQEQYRRVTGRSPSYYRPDGPGKEKVAGQNTDELPVETVSWHDAEELCRLLSELPEERAAGRRYRLPTEAEWEYACRAGTGSHFHFGDNVTPEQLGEHAWFSLNAGGRTRPVRQKRPNPWGLYDMHGNVWEWCADGKRTYEVGVVSDPRGPDQGPRVLRGGSWPGSVTGSRAASRWALGPDQRKSNIGFRVACDP